MGKFWEVWEGIIGKFFSTIGSSLLLKDLPKDTTLHGYSSVHCIVVPFYVVVYRVLGNF